MALSDFHLAPSGSDGPLEPAEIWFRVLRARLDQARHRLTALERASIQLIVERDEGDVAAFVLDVNGVESTLEPGVATNVAALVETTAGEVAALLFATTPPAGALRVRGDMAVVSALFAALADAPMAESWLSLRGRR